MFQKIRDRVRKALLAARLRDRGICPEHGSHLTKRFVGEPSNMGVYGHYYACDQCEAEIEEQALLAKQAHEAQTEAMLKEYREL